MNIANGGFDINKRIVYDAKACGLGYSGVERLHLMLSLPPTMSRSNYDITSKPLSEDVQSVAEETVQEAAENGNKDHNGIAEFAVSADGTWQRRGYLSLKCVFACMSINTGKVLDIEPMSTYCKVCTSNEMIKESDPDKYQSVKADHHCKANYHGSAPNMEAVGVKRIFERSEAKNKLGYVEFYGDGGSKSFPPLKTYIQRRRLLKGMHWACSEACWK